MVARLLIGCLLVRALTADELVIAGSLLPPSRDCYRFHSALQQALSNHQIFHAGGDSWKALVRVQCLGENRNGCSVQHW